MRVVVELQSSLPGRYSSCGQICVLVLGASLDKNGNHMLVMDGAIFCFSPSLQLPET